MKQKMKPIYLYNDSPYRNLKQIIMSWDIFPGSLDDYNSMKETEYEIIKVDRPQKFIYLNSKKSIKQGGRTMRWGGPCIAYEPEELELYEKLVKEGCSGLINCVEKTNNFKRILKSLRERPEIYLGIPVRCKDIESRNELKKKYDSILNGEASESCRGEPDDYSIIRGVL